MCRGQASHLGDFLSDWLPPLSFRKRFLNVTKGNLGPTETTLQTNRTGTEMRCHISRTYVPYGLPFSDFWTHVKTTMFAPLCACNILTGGFRYNSAVWPAPGTRSSNGDPVKRQVSMKERWVRRRSGPEQEFKILPLE